MHYGVKGMKWGVRRFQNKDGSYTEAGKKRYYSSANGDAKDLDKEFKKARRVDRIASVKGHAANALPLATSIAGVTAGVVSGLPQLGVATGSIGAVIGRSIMQNIKDKAYKSRVELLTNTNPVKNEEIRVIPLLGEMSAQQTKGSAASARGPA